MCVYMCSVYVCVSACVYGTERGSDRERSSYSFN